MYIYIYIYVCVCVWESRQFPPGPIEKMKPGKHRSTHKKVPTRYKEIHSERESDRYNVIEIYMYMLYRVSQIDNVSSRDLYSVQSPTLRRVDICIYICIYSVQRPTLRICIYIYIYLSTYIIYLYIYIYIYISTPIFFIGSTRLDMPIPESVSGLHYHCRECRYGQDSCRTLRGCTLDMVPNVVSIVSADRSWLVHSSVLKRASVSSLVTYTHTHIYIYIYILNSCA